MHADVRTTLRGRLLAGVVVGLLAFGSPAPRAVPLRPPPAPVRVQDPPPSGAVAWWPFFDPLRAELN